MVKDLETNAAAGKTPLAEHYNYDRGINGDDGRLNFDEGDLTGGTFKATADIEANLGYGLTFFSRVNGFYDVVMASDSSFERTELLDAADDELVADFRVLDFYVDYDFDMAGLPVLVRAGKQVINWGESTFFLGGNSTFFPIDVGAFRRPGAEVKEALIPVNALYASISLPYEISLEAYAGEWEEFQLDAAGGPFANSDALVNGSDGNRNKFFSGTGAYAGSNRRNCDAATMRAAGSTTDGSLVATSLAGTLLNTMFGECDADDKVDIRTRNPRGDVELGRRSYVSTVVAGQANAGASIGDTDFLTRGKDIEPENDENYGLALRWYSEALNSTEFGFYYQKGYSRIPYVSGIARTPTVGISTTGIANSSTLRGAPLSGCLSGFAGEGFAKFTRDKGDNNSAADATFTTQPEGAIKAYIGQAELEKVIVDDPTGLGKRWEETLFDGSTNEAAVVAAAAANIAATDAAKGALADLANIPADASGDAARTAFVQSRLTAALPTIKNMEEGSLARAQNFSCIASFANSAGGSLLPTGATQLATRYKGELFAEYPEIETWGWSFATTIAGWGVQGEVAYRDNMPLQLDTDAIYIATIAASCAWENFANVADVYYTLQTIKTVCGQFDQVIHGYVTEKVVNYDIGTTATFTRSNPLINVLGADLGILLTEFGLIQAPHTDKYLESGQSRLASRCTSGSDLPLGGVFSLDPRKLSDCRPTETSSGMLLFGQLQYNNAFGTPWSLSPTLIYREGLNGISPVAGGFNEGVKTTSFRLDASLQNKVNVSLGYVEYHGSELLSAEVDCDTLSLNVSYAF